MSSCNPGYDRSHAPGYKQSAKKSMAKTRFYQVAIPGFVPNAEAAEIARGWGQKARILVSNTGPVLIFISDTLTDLTQPIGPSGAIFRLLPGDDQVFIIPPEQKVYGIGAGAGGFVSVSLSMIEADDD